MKINEVALRQKSGIIPFYVDNDKVRMLFMVPSDPNYGGSSPQIAKGGVEPGEDVSTAALREGEEELGLVRSNLVRIVQVGAEQITGLDETYVLSLFVARVKDPANFSTPHFETGKRVWLSLEEFSSRGRKNQVSLVNKAYAVITS